MKFSTLFAACLTCASAASVRKPSSTQNGIISANLRGASEKTAAATDSATQRDSAVMLNRKLDSAVDAISTAKTAAKTNSTACVNSTTGEPCGTQTEHHPCSPSSPCDADASHYGPCSSKESPCEEKKPHRPPLPRGHHYYSKQCSDCYYKANQCGCEPALEFMACLTKFCHDPNTTAFAETCADLSNRCYDQMDLNCQNDHTYCKSKWNQLPVGGLGLTVKVNEDDAYCGPSGKCLGNLVFNTEIVNLPHPPQGCQPKAYAVNYTDGGCSETDMFNNQSNTLVWTGYEADEELCQARCDGDDRCNFYSFCPTGTGDCTGVNENKCATFRECKAYLKHTGFTTYERNPDRWHNEHVRSWAPPCMNLAGDYVATDGSKVHLKQSGCSGKGHIVSGPSKGQHFAYTTISNKITVVPKEGSADHGTGLVSQEGTTTEISLSSSNYTRDQCPDPIWVECGLPRVDKPNYEKKHDWHICEMKAEGEVANCSLHLPKNWVMKEECDEVYCALKDGFGKRLTAPQWYKICNMYGKGPKVARVVEMVKPKPVPAARPRVVQEEPCDPCQRPCPGVNFHAEKINCDKSKKAAVNVKADNAKKPKNTEKSKSLSWWVSKDDKAEPPVAFR